MSYTATQVGDAYEAILRVAPPGGLTGAYDVSVAAQINGGFLTLAGYETSLITSDQALYTTEAALVTYDAFYNAMPTSAVLTTIAVSTSGNAGNGNGLLLPDGQLYYPAQELHNLGYSDANVWTILGADFATDTHSSFYTLYGGLATGNMTDYATFINTVYQHEFGYLPSATNLNYLLADIPGLSALLGGAGGAATPLQIEGGLYGYLLYAGETNNLGIFAHPTSAFLMAAATDEATTPGSSAPLYTGELVSNMAIVVDVTNGGTPTATEGVSVTFQVTSTNVAAGTVLNYTLSGVTASEVVGGQLTGTVAVGAHGTASIPVVLTSTPGQGLTGPLEVTLAALPNESPTSVNTATVALTETQTSYTLTDTAPSPTTEGSSVIFHLASNGIVPNGGSVAYTLSGVTASEVVGGQLTGTATIVNGVANIPVTLNSVPGEGLSGHLTATLTLPAGANSNSVGTASVALTETPATYSITDTGNITQGSAETFLLHTNMPAGTVDSWALSGAAVSQVVPPVSGTVTFDVNGNASVTVTTSPTVINGPASEPLTFTLSNGVVNVATATVNVTEATATLSDTNSHAINEGSTANFTLATTNLANGTQLSYTLSGPGVAQLVDPTQVTGTLTVSGNAATLNVATLADVFNAPGAAPLVLTLNGVPGAGATDTVNINENSNIAVANPAAVSEGSPLVFNVSTTNVPVGTAETFTLSGTGTGQVTSPLTGIVTVGANGLATVTVNTAATVFNAAAGAQDPVVLTLTGLAGATATGQINENATISVATSATPVNEGGAVTFDLFASPNVPAGTQVSYTLSGPALGNVLPALQTGTATVSPGGEVFINVPTLANDPSGETKGLTLTLNNLNNGVADPTVALAEVNENAAGVFVLTTGTDNGAAPGQPFYGNPVGGNNYFATQATLGQTDVLNAGGGPNNELFLTTSGFFSFITSFTTVGIQTFDINANSTTVIDMSSTTGVTTVIDDNSSASLTLSNVQAPVALTILNPSAIFPGTNTVTIGYVAAAQGGTQYVTLINTLDPLTGMPNNALSVVGMPTLSISSQGTATNGLISVVDPQLTHVVFTATPAGDGTDQSFVLGNGTAGGVPLAFAGANHAAGTNVLDLSAWTGTFFDIGNGGANAITSAGGLTIDGGAGGMNSQFTPNVFGGAKVTGGGIQTVGSLTINLGDPAASSFLGQQLLSTAGNILIQGTVNTTPAGFLNNGGQSTNIATDGGSVTIEGFKGGLGGPGATITTNGASAATGGNVTIGVGAGNAVTGGIIEIINTAGTVNGGVVAVNLSQGTNTLIIQNSGDAHTAVGISGGTNTVDFSNPTSTGFHGGNIYDPTPDSVTASAPANPANQTLVLDPQLLGGNATGVQNINFATGNMTAGSPVYMAALDQTGIVQTITVTDTIGANPDLSYMTSGDTLDFSQIAAATYTLNTGFTSNGAELELYVKGGSTVTVTNTDSGSLATLNFHVVDGTTVLNISDDPGLTTLGLFGGNSSDFLNVFAVPTNYATITAVTGHTDQANVNMAGLAADLSVSDALTGGGAPVDTINLGNGNDTIAVTNVIGGFDGSWAITAGDGNNVVTVTPQFGDYDVIHLGLTGSGGNNTINVNGVGGVVNIHTGSGNDTVIFNQSTVNLTDADTLTLGAPNSGDYNQVTIIDGAVNLNDSIFQNWTDVDQLNLAAGFANSLILDVNAAANAGTIGNNVFTIDTGGNNGAIPGSTTIYAGAGYTGIPLAVNVAEGGDAGGDSIQMNHYVTGSLTVTASVTDYDTSFESALTTVQLAPEGVFGYPTTANTLQLYADNNLATIDILNSAVAGLQGVQTIDGEYGGVDVGMGVWLANNHASTASTINLSAVDGTTDVWAQTVTNHAALTITGGGTYDPGYYYNYNTLYADNGADILTANADTWNAGANPLLDIQNFIVSGGGANHMTGVAGLNNTGTAFAFNSLTDLLNNAAITNYHTATDAIFVPTASVQAANAAVLLGPTNTDGAIIFEGSVTTPVGASTATIYTYLNSQLDTVAPGNAIQAVYDTTTGLMYLDIGNTPIFNSDTISFAISYASTPGLTDLTTAQFNAYAAESNLFFNGTSIVPDLQISGADVTVTQWNFFETLGLINGQPGGGNTAIFDGPGGAITTSANVGNYNFSDVTGPMSVTTTGYTGGAPTGPGTITGTSYGDSFFVSSAELFGGLIIDGGSGANQITIDPVGPLTITLSSSTFGAGVGEVANVQTLNLVDTAGNTVSFDAGVAFAHVNVAAGAGPTVINTAHMAQDAVNGDSLTFANTAGNTVNLAPGAVADGTPAATIKFSSLTSAENNVVSSVGGTINTIIQGGGYTTLDLINNDNITAAVLSGIDTLNIANNAHITLTGSEWNGFTFVTSGNGDATVNFTGNEMVTATPNLYSTLVTTATYNLGGSPGQTNQITLVNNEHVLGVLVPGANTFIGTVDGGAANDTVVVGALSLGLVAVGATHIDLGAGLNHISVSNGANLGPALSGTTIIDTGGTTELDITGSGAATVTMSNAEYAIFELALGGINIGSTSGDTVVFSDTDGNSNFTLDANILNWDLAGGGPNSYTLGAADQNVTGNSGADNINVGSYDFTGTLALHSGANVVDVSDGADLAGGTISVSGSGHAVLNFNGSGVDHVTMTSGQENFFDAASTGGTMTSGGGVANVINITDNASHVVLDANEAVVGTVNLQASSTIVDLSVGGGAIAGWAGTLNLGSALSQQTVNINNGTPGVALGTNDHQHYSTITNFVPGTIANPVDFLHLVFDGNVQTWGELVVTPSFAAAEGPNSIISISGSIGNLSSGDIGGATLLADAEGLVHSALLSSTVLTSGDEYTFLMSAPQGVAIIEAHAASANTIDGVQLIGVISGQTSDFMVPHNFV